MPRWSAAFFALILLTLGSACTERPQDGFDALLVAMQQGEIDAAWDRFDRPSKAMLRDTAAMLRAEGKLEGSAKAHLLSGFLPQGLSAVELIEKTDTAAVLELTDFDGKKQRVQMRFEDERWRLHIDGASAHDTIALNASAP